MDERVYNSLDRIEEKLDAHIERIVRVEERVSVQGGAIKMALSGVIAVITSMAAYLIKTFIGK